MNAANVERTVAGEPGGPPSQSRAAVGFSASRLQCVRLGRIAGALFIAFGAALAAGGLRLVMLGGSPYYLATGF